MVSSRGPHDGFFEWWLESFFTLQCKFELALYPFDKQVNFPAIILSL